MKREYKFERGYYDACDCYTEQDVVMKIDEYNIEVIFYDEMFDSDEKYESKSIELDRNTFDKLIKIYQLDLEFDAIK